MNIQTRLRPLAPFFIAACLAPAIAVATPVSAQTAPTTQTVSSNVTNGPRGRLFVLTVGAGAFNDSAVRGLPVSMRDADDVAYALKAQNKTGLYTSVAARTVTGKAATRQGVRDALQWLKGNVGANDVAVIFVSGHKIVDSELNPRLLTADVKTDSVGMMRATSLSVGEIQTLAQDLPGKTLLLLDLSHGSPVNDLPENLFAITPKKPKMITRSFSRLGTMRLGQATGQLRTLYSATGNEVSRTTKPSGNSVFATAILQEISRPTPPGEVPVTANALLESVTKRVTQATDGQQTPFIEDTEARPVDYPVAVPVPLAQPAPNKPAGKPASKPTSKAGQPSKATRPVS